MRCDSEIDAPAPASVGACCASPKPSSASCCGDPLAVEWLRIGLAGLVAAQSMIFSLAINLTPEEGPPPVYLHVALALAAMIVYFLVGIPLTRSAWSALVQRRIVVDQLFLVGIAGAFALSVHSSLTGHGTVYYEVVAILLAIHTFGRVLAERNQRKAGDAMQRLRRELDTVVRVSCCGKRETVEAKNIAPGDLVEISAGGLIAVDGRIVEGAGYLRETSLTGEPFPVAVGPGRLVRAGAYSVDAVFRIQAFAGGGNREIDLYLAGVESALRVPSGIQRQADRIASWFLPVVLIVAACTTAFWAWQSGWPAAVFNGLAVILVACPCALGLATPIGLWTALNRLAALGLVARSGDVIETLAAADVMIFDKTGTLTEETMRLVGVESPAPDELPDLLAMVAALETGFQHPIAEVFRPFARPDAIRCTRAAVLPGLGVEGEVWTPDGVSHRIAAGNFKLGSHFGIDLPDDALQALIVVCDGKLAATAQLEEIRRDSAVDTLEALAAMGLEPRLLSGDTDARVTALAAACGIEASGGLSPGEKIDVIKKLWSSGKTTVFVGDGLNDAGAIAAAQCGIALGHGAALTRDAADVVMTHGNLAVLPEAIRDCRMLVKVIRENILFAGMYNVVGMILAACGLLHPVAAALLMLVASVTVVTRALRFDQRSREGRLNAPARFQFPKISRVGLLTGGLLFLQFLMVAWLGGFASETLPLFVGFGIATGAVGVWCWERTLPGSTGRMLLAMVAAGGPAMLAGWWVDAGFGAIVREGVCLCGCVNSNMGWGVVLNPTWMHLGMLLAGGWTMSACMKTRMFANARVRMLAIGISVAAMMLGMELGALAMAPLPVEPANRYFLFSYLAMMTGMTLVMILACAWTRRRWEIAPGKPMLNASQSPAKCDPA